jgi:hypothetical protein
MRAFIVIAACALVAVLGAHARSARSDTAGGPEITDAERAATLDLYSVPLQDRQWIQAAIAAARPEAQRLIAEVDGLVDVRVDLNRPGTIYLGVPSEVIGLTRLEGHRVTIALDAGRLDGERVIDRPMVVLHELGHVIDYLLVDDERMAQLDAAIPVGDCQVMIADGHGCTSVEERFADTFAKWALRGSFSLAGSGYGIPTPPSLEDWGQPLGRLALELDAKSR